MRDRIARPVIASPDRVAQRLAWVIIVSSNTDQWWCVAAAATLSVGDQP